MNKGGIKNMKEVMTESDEKIFSEMMNRLYYLKIKYQDEFIKYLESELKRKRQEEENVKKIIEINIARNFDKRTTKKLIKILK